MNSLVFHLHFGMMHVDFWCVEVLFISLVLHQMNVSCTVNFPSGNSTSIVLHRIEYSKVLLCLIIGCFMSHTWNCSRDFCVKKMHLNDLLTRGNIVSILPQQMSSCPDADFAWFSVSHRWISQIHQLTENSNFFVDCALMFLCLVANGWRFIVMYWSVVFSLVHPQFRLKVSPAVSIPSFASTLGPVEMHSCGKVL